MARYVIQPIAALLEGTSAREFQRADLRGAQRRVEKTLRQKQKHPAQAHSALIERKYLEYFREIEKKFSRAGKISRTQLIKTTDKLIRREHLCYYGKTHAPAHNNYFLKLSPKPSKCYDIAFYNKLAPANPKAHHKHWWRNSVHYARIERKGKEALIGNIQIDAPSAPDWKNNEARQILLMRKNIYRTMVEEALQQALRHRPRRVLFHSGETMQLAQHNNDAGLFKVKITKKNYADYQIRHDNFIAQLAAAWPGEPTPRYNKQLSYPGIILHKNNGYTAIHRKGYQGGMTLLDYIKLEAEKTAGGRLPKRTRQALKRIDLMKKKLWKTNDYKKLLDEIEQIFNYINPERTSKLISQKIATLKKLFTPLPPPTRRPSDHPHDPRPVIKKHSSFFAARLAHGVKLDQALDKFLISYNYHLEFRRAYPAHKIIHLSARTAERLERSPVLLYHPVRDAGCIKTIRIKDIICPKIGESYLIPKENLNTKWPLMKFTHPRINNFMFYEKTLPKIFQRLGLKYRKTIIELDGLNTTKCSEAWEILSDLEAWRKKPLVSF